MKSFDDIIRGKLDDLPPLGSPDWDSLNEVLDGESFDEMLRAGMQPPATEPLANAAKVVPMVVGWDALSDKLNLEAEAGGEVFDRLLSQKLAVAEAAMSAEPSWRQLSHRMDTFWPVRRRVARYRILEIAAAVALLLTFGPLLRDNPVFDGYGLRPAISEAKSYEAPTTPNPYVELPTLDIDLSVYDEDAANGVYVGIADGSVGRESLDRSARLNTSAFAMVREAAGRLFSVFGSVDELPSASEIEDAQGRVTEANYFVTGPLSPAGGDDRSALRLGAISFDAEVAPLAHAPADLSLPALAAAKSSKWQLGINSGAHLWNIRTPVDRDLGLSAASRRRVGGSVGVDAVRRLGGDWQLGLGLAVTPVSYDPGLPLVVIENAVRNLDRIERFEGISTNIATLPVTARRQLNPANDKTRVFAKAGLAANVVLSTKYDFQTSLAEVPRISPRPPVGGPASGLAPTPIAVPESLESSRPFTPGLLTGGKLARNAYVSALVGVEVQRRVNDRINVHAGLDYNQFLGPPQGLGPNRDRASSLGLTIGARVNL